MDLFRERWRRLGGFTLIEILVALAIIAIVSVIGINTMTSRSVQIALEESAKSLRDDLSYARMAATLKGCPTRFIFCMDKLCNPGNAQNSSITGIAGGIVGASGSPAQFYSIMRMTTPCSSQAGVDASQDGFANWDHDVKPRQLPGGVVFSSIYTSSGVINRDNWTSSTGNAIEAGNSLWFSPTLSPTYGTIPAGGAVEASGNFIAFQLRLAACDPSQTDDCSGYFITMSPGGVSGIKKCFNGGRSVNNTDKCF
jgi:prepilin-type N-terminal cleavage/methylation domain-containing protein